ncbi:hypothetical protein [Nonomuraea sp. NPDC049607]|uniref:hypothetical protein n=1 Tax=Nonomuraea sp. NPDC049607 TaxID=3154732 RepID=UPI0034210DCA
MTTPTNTTGSTQGNAASTNGATPKQATRTLFIVITVQSGHGEISTSSHNVTVPVGMRHENLLTQVLKEGIPEHLRGRSVVLHYSVHPAVVA